MDTVFIIGIWAILVLLVAYTISTAKGYKWAKNRDIIRKSWYLILILGVLIYFSKNGFDSLFDNWERYLIILVGFMVVDSLVFLNLYFKKFSGNELSEVEKQVDDTQKIIDTNKEKFSNMEESLNTFPFINYTTDSNEYVQELEDFFSLYAEKELLIVEVIPIRSEEELNSVFPEPSDEGIRRKLKLNRSHYSKKDDLALFPLSILNERYVAKMTRLDDDGIINGIDGQVINMLLMVYTLAVVFPTNDEGGVE